MWYGDLFHNSDESIMFQIGSLGHVANIGNRIIAPCVPQGHNMKTCEE